MVYLFLANGFEEIEAVVPIDILRRAGVEVKTVSVNDGLEVEGRSRIKMVADCTIKDIDVAGFEMAILPGGQPGTSNLESCGKIREAIKYGMDNGKWIAAICAAPTVLGKAGYLEGKEAVCYPGCEGDLKGAVIGEEAVARCGNIITSRGAGTAMDFAFELVTVLRGEKTAADIKSQVVYGDA